MARLEGVPPNISVSSTTPSPVSQREIASLDVSAAAFDIILGSDTDRIDVPLRPYHMFHGGSQFLGQPAVGHQNHADHLWWQASLVKMSEQVVMTLSQASCA